MHIILGSHAGDNRRTLANAMTALREADMRVQQHRQVHGMPAAAQQLQQRRQRHPANAAGRLQLQPRQAVAAFFQALGAFMAHHRVNLRVSTKQLGNMAVGIGVCGCRWLCGRL